MFIAPVYRLASMLMGCKQPLDISTIQFDIFEGIGTLPNIWFGGKTFSKVCLTTTVNFRLCAPGLTTLLPVGMPGITVTSGWVLWRAWQLICLLIHINFLLKSSIHYSFPLSTRGRNVLITI